MLLGSHGVVGDWGETIVEHYRLATTVVSLMHRWGTMTATLAVQVWRVGIVGTIVRWVHTVMTALLSHSFIIGAFITAAWVWARGWGWRWAAWANCVIAALFVNGIATGFGLFSSIVHRSIFFLVTFGCRLLLLGELVRVLGSLVPHHKVVSLVHLDRALIHLRVLGFQLCQESHRELLAPFASTEPNFVEVAVICEVLSDGNRQVQVQDSVPPVAGDKDSLTGVLHAFDNCRQPIGSFGSLNVLEPGEHLIKVLDRLVIFAFLQQMFTSHQLLGHTWAWWHHDPAFMATDTRVPGWGSKRVLMDLTARSEGTNQEPSMGRSFLLSELKTRITVNN